MKVGDRVILIKDCSHICGICSRFLNKPAKIVSFISDDKVEIENQKGRVECFYIKRLKKISTLKFYRGDL